MLLVDKVLEIPLTRGKTALVDAEDYEALSSHKWFCSARGYAVRTVSVNGRNKTLRMHSVLVATPEGMEVDHINGDRLDNRRCNLRLATHAQNVRNAGMRKDNTSGFKGVCYYPLTKRWTSQINVRGRRKRLGYFSTPEEAHAAYCVAALQHHGEFARTS